MRKDRDNRIYCSVMNYDQFVGFSIPKNLEYIIDFIKEKTDDEFIDQVFDDYDEYRDYEVECASQARHGSSGTTDIDTIEEFVKEYSWHINDNDDIKKFFENINIKEETINIKNTSNSLTGFTY
jgi:hypothetical protein